MTNNTTSLNSSSAIHGKTTVAVIGGGLAGLAAGSALASIGIHVTLFERRPYLGGRASSYQHPGTGEVVDNCQHVLLGCCTNLIDFYGRLGVLDKILWYDELNFIEPSGRISTLKPSALPAPFHTAPAFVRIACLNFADKAAIARAIAILARGMPPDSGKSFLDWLREHRQTENAIERFWKTILVSALNEDLDHISIPYAAQVIRESFLNSAEAGRIGIPSVPLSELYGVAGEYIEERSGQVRLRCSVEALSPQSDGITLRSGPEDMTFDCAISAVPFDVLSRLLPKTSDAASLQKCLTKFRTSPITGIHLWFDRQITDLDHAVLLDRTIQWMFHKSKLLRPKVDGATGVPARPDQSYIELVVSASKALVEKSKAEIVDLAVRELIEFFPAVRNAVLLKSTVIKEVHATYSPEPGADAYRPKPATLWPRVFLAGDWTATGWPATMEGAVRSGYAAAEEVARALGRHESSFLVPGLPSTGFMKFLAH